MIFKCFRTLAPRFATNYTQAMYEAWKVNPDSVHEDWHHAFKNQQQQVNVGSPEHIEREKSLALSAYMLIRYYKMRGHEEALLDPLSILSDIQDWSISRSLVKFSQKINFNMILLTTRFFMISFWMSLLHSHRIQPLRIKLQ